jgi:hypothetical protein
LLIVALGVYATHAEIVEVPLPEFNGDYPGEGIIVPRVVSFQLERVPTVVHGASIRLAGETDVGQLFCSGAGLDGYHSWPFNFYAILRDSVSGGSWKADTYAALDQGGPFEITIDFKARSGPTPTWSFLLDGESDIELTGGPVGYVAVCSALTPPPSAVINEATLLIDGDFPIPVEQSTWGRVKAVFKIE